MVTSSLLYSSLATSSEPTLRAATSRTDKVAPIPQCNYTPSNYSTHGARSVQNAILTYFQKASIIL